MHRDYAAEIREIVDDHMIAGSPLGSALSVVADAIEQQAAHFTAQLNALSERVDACEAAQVLA